MKGAIAEPLVSTTRPPKHHHDQDRQQPEFLPHAHEPPDLGEEIYGFHLCEVVLKLIFHGLWRWPRRLPDDPIGIVLRVPLETQKVFVAEA